MQAITTTYHGPTDTKGARITARAGDNRKTVSFDYGARDPHFVAVEALCEKMNWTGTMVSGSLPNGDRVWVWLTDDTAHNVPVVRI